MNVIERRKLNYPESVRKQKGVSGAETLCRSGKGSMRLIPGSYAVFDMGAASVGGYPFFLVGAHRGEVCVHISYSDRMTPYEREETMGMGDFTRGSCTYLGVELPVMPANPYRFEDYVVRRPGLFVYPLIQGQERFVCLSMAEECGGEVEITAFGIADDSVDMTQEGSFRSDCAKLDRIWQASARTVRLATVQSNQWDVLFGKLCVRKLTRHEGGGLSRQTVQAPFRFDCTLQLCLNPEHETGAELLFGAEDTRNAWFLRLMQGGGISFGRIENGGRRTLESKQVSPFADNLPCRAEIEAGPGELIVRLDGKTILRSRTTVGGGRFGFFSEAEWRFTADAFRVESDGGLYEWGGELSDFDLVCSGAFVSDGAKRDRLPWSGDLDWAIDCGWYAFGSQLEVMNTLKLLAFHQNPDGFIFGTCYPENRVRPGRGEYGYYQSDMFAAWFIVSAFTYYRLSGDAAVREVYPAVQKCLDYLWRYVDPADGLFDQRYETSKGLWDHFLGDTGKNTYTNLLLLESLNNTADFAAECGDAAYAAGCRSRAARLREGIFRELYDEELGGFVKRKDWRELCDMSNPFAMGKGLVSAGQAAAIAARAEQVTHAYGKIEILMIRGLYEYGYAEKAERMLFGKMPLYADGAYFSNVDWMSVIGHPDLPETVYECMHNPPYNFGANQNWGDLSHPDSGICGILSAYIAGVRPLASGFSEVLICPHPGGCRQIDCTVPTAHGGIEVHLRESAAGTEIRVRLPRGVRCREDYGGLKQPVHAVVEYYDAFQKQKEVV